MEKGGYLETLRNADRVTDSLVVVGRLFQIIGPITLKAFGPRTLFAWGTFKRVMSSVD